MADLTHRRILHIAVPIVISNATVPILGLVDTGVVGQMGAAAPIGAVGIGAIILGSIYWIFGFLRMGTVGLTSQALGANDDAEVTALFSRAMLIGLVAGCVIIISQAFLFREAFKLSPASAEVENLARQYLAIRVWSAPAAIAIYGLSGWLIAQERTRAVMAVQLLVNGTNIVLDLVFVIGFDWGVSGVATATFIAEWLGLALGIWLCRGVFDHPAWREKARLFDPARLRNMALVNGDILIRSVLLQTIFVSFLFFGADFGDTPLAANQVLLQFLFLTSFAMDGFAFAVESLVGKAMGAKAPLAIRRASIMTGMWAFGICVTLALAFAIGGGLMIDLMTTAPDVRSEARTYLPYMIAAPIVGCAAWMLDGIFIGATRTKDMRNMMIISTVFYFATVIPLISLFGNHGLWIGLLLSFIIRGITLGMRYRSLERAALA